MKPIASSISHGPDKWLSASVTRIFLGVHVVEEFIEDGDQRIRMAGRAHSTVISTDRVSHMRLVIGTVQNVVAYPARWEENLGSEAVWTFHVGKGRYFWIVCVVVDASIVDRHTGNGCGRCSEFRVSRRHTEALGESLRLYTW